MNNIYYVINIVKIIYAYNLVHFSLLEQLHKWLSKCLRCRIPADIFHTSPEANLQIECTLPYFGPLQKKAGSATVEAGLFLLSCEAAFSG